MSEITTRARPIVVGSEITVRGHLCRVFKVHPFGTIDVESLCGRFAWRVTGLALALVLALLTGCALYDDAPPVEAGPDAGEVAPVEVDAPHASADAPALDAAPEPDAPPAVGSPCVVGAYRVTYTFESGTCGPIDLGVLTFNVHATGGNPIVVSDNPLVGGTAWDVDGKCALDVWRAGPYGQAVLQVHTRVSTPWTDDAGALVSMGQTDVTVLNATANVACSATFMAHAAITE
jgi:hypothetical protein